MSQPTTDRRDLPDRYFVSPNSMGRWHLGGVHNQYPDKSELETKGLQAVCSGWLPEHPFISARTRLLAVGSCFAQNFALWLSERGFGKQETSDPENALLRFNADFESPAVMAQQFRWAFDELDPVSMLWIDKHRHLIEATDEGKLAVRRTLEQADVMIMTLGLSEVWYDRLSGEPLWRALTDKTFDPDRHVFRVESVADTIEWLSCIERLRKRYLPSLRIIFTISPIPLKTTFRPVSAITANSVSKAILRCALDEFLRANSAEINHSLFYFPSYEMVTTYFSDPFVEDNRHIGNSIIDQIVAFFAAHYCEGIPVIDSHGSTDEAGQLEQVFLSDSELRYRELETRLLVLQEEKSRLQDICDERKLVIDELAQAAAERLDVIDQLDKALKQRAIKRMPWSR